MKHTDEISFFKGDFKKLSEEIGNLKYDSLAIFLTELANKIEADGKKDFDRGRLQLAKELFATRDSLNQASEKINKSWLICKPYMKE